jgi:hypothetical protein
MRYRRWPNHRDPQRSASAPGADTRSVEKRRSKLFIRHGLNDTDTNVCYGHSKETKRLTLPVLNEPPTSVEQPAAVAVAVVVAVVVAVAAAAAAAVAWWQDLTVVSTFAGVCTFGLSPPDNKASTYRPMYPYPGSTAAAGSDSEWSCAHRAATQAVAVCPSRCVRVVRRLPCARSLGRGPAGERHAVAARR